MNYQERLKNIRIEKNILQKDIANYLNLSPITYSHYETGDTTIPIKHLISIANYLTISIDYIFNLSNTKTLNLTHKSINKNIIGTRLKELRKEHKLTQEKMAKILNTDKTVICRYENGTNIIATPFLYTICFKYKISADYLLGRTDTPKYLK